MTKLAAFFRCALCAAAFLPLLSHAFVFAVNEGATYRVTDAEIQLKYKPLADDLSKLLGRKVTVTPVSDYKEIAEGLRSSRFDLAYVHPAHLALQGLAVDGYRLVALTKGYTDYRAHFLVRADSVARGPADLRGKKVGAPSPDSITAVLMRTTLRESLKEATDSVNVIPTRYQDAIPFMVEHGLADVGVTGSDEVARKWAAGGGKVAFTSKSVPVKLMLASKRVGAEDLASLQNYFVSLEQTEPGRRTLDAISKKGFVPFDGNALAAVNTWLATGLR